MKYFSEIGGDVVQFWLWRSVFPSPFEEGMRPPHDTLNRSCVQLGSQFVFEFLHEKNYIEY